MCTMWIGQCAYSVVGQHAYSVDRSVFTMLIGQCVYNVERSCAVLTGFC